MTPRVTTRPLGTLILNESSALPVELRLVTRVSMSVSVSPDDRDHSTRCAAGASAFQHRSFDIE